MAKMAVVGGNGVIPIHHHRKTLIPTSFTQLKLPAAHSHRVSIMSASATANNAIRQHGLWSEFASNVSGEWDGFGADFTMEGNPIELPENVVPNAYREWDVKVLDWQTQCPTLAQPNDRHLIYKLIKLLPTVGCEADAATRHSIIERTIGGPNSTVSAFAYHPSGPYTAVWATGPWVLELEHCLVDPRDKESRVRVVQVVGVEGTRGLALKNVRVFVERWYGPFRNGDQLGGCGLRDSAFASTRALASSEVFGVWRCLKSVANFQDSPQNTIQELVAVDGLDTVVRHEADLRHLVLLPNKLWSSVKETQDGEETWCEVGWMLESGFAVTSKCVFSRNAQLKEMVTASETADAI